MPRVRLPAAGRRGASAGCPPSPPTTEPGEEPTVETRVVPPVLPTDACVFDDRTSTSASGPGCAGTLAPSDSSRRPVRISRRLPELELRRHRRGRPVPRRERRPGHPYNGEEHTSAAASEGFASHLGATAFDAGDAGAASDDPWERIEAAAVVLGLDAEVATWGSYNGVDP